MKNAHAIANLIPDICSIRDANVIRPRPYKWHSVLIKLYLIAIQDTSHAL